MEITSRLANPPESLLAKYTRKEREFFYDYASFVLRLSNSPLVKERLNNLIASENIRTNKPIDLRIMVFPAQPLNGRPRNTLHGSYNQDSSQISIYPLKLPRDWIRKEGSRLFRTRTEQLTQDDRKLLGEISKSAMSTLVHEILHVKFEERNLARYVEEAIVRKLERTYVAGWTEGLVETSTFSAESTS